MPEKNLVSFIIAAYNVSDYIVEAVNSCLQQTHNNTEVIITDDGSTDETFKIISQHYANNIRVKIFRFPENRGKISAFNNSFSRARGEFIAIFGADDVNELNRVEVSIQILKKYNVDLICTDMSYLNGKKARESVILSNDPKREESHVITLDMLCKKSLVFGGTILAKKTCLDKIFPLSIKLASEDWWIPFKASTFGNLYYSNKMLCRYRLHSSNSSIHIRKKKILMSFRVWKQYYSRHLPFFELCISELKLNNKQSVLINNRMFEQAVIRLPLLERVFLLKYNFDLNLLLSLKIIFKILSPKLSWIIYLLIKNR